LPSEHWTLDEEQGGGRIIGEGCHFIDFMIFLTGSLPISVRTEGIGGDYPSPEENVTITLQFADGSLGTIVYTSGGDRSFSKERLEVFAGGRVAVLDDFKSLEMVSQGKRQIKRTRGAQDKGHYAEWKAFIAAIEKGGPPPIPYEQLLAATTASFAALESLHSRQTVNLKTFTQN
jgi:predicted dehydrogenase